MGTGGSRPHVGDGGGGSWPFGEYSKRVYLSKYKSQNHVVQKARIGQDGQKQGHDYEALTISKLGIYARLLKGNVRKYL
jgi:hypothetical protein